MWNFSISILTSLHFNQYKSIATYQYFSALIHVPCMAYNEIILCRYRCWFYVHREQLPESRNTSPNLMISFLFLNFNFITVHTDSTVKWFPVQKVQKDTHQRVSFSQPPTCHPTSLLFVLVYIQLLYKYSKCSCIFFVTL